MDDGIKKNPYKGIIITCVLLIAVPLGMYFLFKNIIFKNQLNFSDELNQASAVFLGFGVGFIFQLSCIWMGLVKGSFKVVVKRFFDFIANLSISFKFAIKLYWDDIVENGVVFWIIMPIIIATLCITISGLKDFIALI